MSEHHDDVASIISALSGSNSGSNPVMLRSGKASKASLLGSHNKQTLSDGSDALRDALSGIAPPNRFPSLAGSSFLEKFASVADKTRDLELGRPPQQQSGRRGSVLVSELSEKLDSYISATNSPSQSRHLSFGSQAEKPAFDNIWHPGSASTFAPDPVPNAINPTFMMSAQPPMMMPPPFMNGFAPMFMPPPFTEHESAIEEENEDSQQQEGEDRPVSPPFVMVPPFNMYGAPAFIPMSPIAGTPPPLANPQQMFPGQGIPSPTQQYTNGNGNNGGNRKKSPTASNSANKKASTNSKKSGANLNPKFKSKQPIIRSEMLEKFRLNKNHTNEYTLDDIISHALEFSKDQHGSRFIQHKLSQQDTPVESKDAFFNEISGHCMDLITDVFGNYIIQKYFELGSADQCQTLYSSMKGSFYDLSLQMYGCRVVQKCLENIPLENQLTIIDELSPYILTLIKDQNGNHVIQKSIEQISPENLTSINDAIKGQVYELSLNPYGCRVIQRLLEFSDVPTQNYILSQLDTHIGELMKDQFGNYVIQHIIQSKNYPDEFMKKVLNVVMNDLLGLAKHKFASNAIERCIVYLDKGRDSIYDVMLDEKEAVNGETMLLKMMKDPFANYVVQRMVELTVVPAKKQLLIAKIRTNLVLIKGSNQGKHLASIEKLEMICNKA